MKLRHLFDVRPAHRYFESIFGPKNYILEVDEDRKVFIGRELAPGVSTLYTGRTEEFPF